MSKIKAPGRWPIWRETMLGFRWTQRTTLSRCFRHGQPQEHEGQDGFVPCRKANANNGLVRMLDIRAERVWKRAQFEGIRGRLWSCPT